MSAVALSRALIPAEGTLVRQQHWSRFAGPIVSILLLAAIIWQLEASTVTSLPGLLPHAPQFWLLFALFYFSTPFAEWLIYRRLWRIPAAALGALLRKRVGNELLFGFAGEIYLYAWARRSVRDGVPPFAAIKDVTLLSGVVGNGFTLAMLAAVVPFAAGIEGWGRHGSAILVSGLALIGMTLGVLLLRGRLFSLTPRELWIAAGLHGSRIAVTTLLTAALWHVLLPNVAWGWWLLLAAIRLLVSRLPMVPNKDVLFAGFAALFVPDPRIAAIMTLMATIILAAHLVVVATLSGQMLFRWVTR